jgi:MFS family permease
MSGTSTIRAAGARLGQIAAQITAGGSWSSQLPRDVQWNLRWYYFDGLFSAASDAINANYLVLFILILGASAAQIGLMTALASLMATILLIPGAMIADQSGNRKLVCVGGGGGIGRLMILLMALLPFVLAGPAAVAVAIALKVILDGMNNFSYPAWASINGEIVPIAWRGRYFSARNITMGIFGMVVTFLAGQFLTHNDTIQGYQIALGFAFMIGMISSYSFWNIKVKDVRSEMPASATYSPKSLWKSLSSDRHFLLYWGYSLVWNLAMGISGPFFTPYMVQNLHANASEVGMLSILSSLASLPALRYFGGLMDRWGATRVQLLTGFLIPLLPLAWVFTNAPYQGWLINIPGGILWAGYNLAAFSYMLELAPPEQRARYAALLQVAIAIAGAIGNAAGGFVATAWGYKANFIISFVGRSCAALLLYFILRRHTAHPAQPVQPAAV